MSVLAENLSDVRERIASAARRAGRDPADVKLVAVTKTQPVEVICEAIELGLTDLAENRVEEAGPKIEAVWGAGKRATWHMIGHIQRRKARAVAEYFDLVHSVDSAKLAERLSRFAGERGKTLPALIECNVSGEASKSGLPAARFFESAAQAAEVFSEVEAILAQPHLRVCGLMTMAPIVADPQETRPVFRSLRRLREALAARFPAAEWHELSMGMTDDFEVAIEEGATLVRIGRAIFGERR